MQKIFYRIKSSAIKTKSSSELLAYLEEQYTIKNKLLIDAQDNLANFKDRNLNISRSSFSNAQTRLEADTSNSNFRFSKCGDSVRASKITGSKRHPSVFFFEASGGSNRKICSKT